MWKLISTVGTLAAAMAPGPALTVAANDLDAGYASVTSATDTVRAKTATVTCPDGTVAFGAGGHVNGGDGSVVLTAIVPAADLSGVSVGGLARADFTGAWSVSAVAVCGPIGFAALLRVGVTVDQSNATARCPNGRVLYATGFAMVEPNPGRYVDAVVPASDLSAVTVHGGGSGSPPAGLAAYGICGARPPRAERTSAVSDADSGRTRTVIAPRPAIIFDWGSAMVGAGAVVSGGGAFLDGFGPLTTLDGAIAHGVAPVPSVPGAGIRAGTSAGWDLTAYGVYIGSWY